MNSQSLQTLSALVFIAFYMLTDLYTASIALCLCSLTQLALSFLYDGSSRIERYNLIAIAGFSFMTWWFQDQRYIQWKVSIMHLFMAAAIHAYRCITSRPAVQSLLSQQKISVATSIAKTIDDAFIFFFTSVALANAFVLTYCSLNTWVVFKGSLLVINLIFIALLLYRFKDSIEVAT